MNKKQEEIINNTKSRFVFSQKKSNLISLIILLLIFGIIAFRNNFIDFIIYLLLISLIFYFYLLNRLEVHLYDNFFITKPILGNKKIVYNYEDIENVVFNKSGFRGGSLLKFTFRSNNKVKTLRYNKSIMEPKAEFKFLESKNVKCEILLKGKQKKQKNNYRV